MRDSILKKLNILIAVLHILLFPIWVFVWMLTSWTSDKFLMASLLCAMLLGIVYKKVRDKKHGMKVIHVLRAVLVVCIAGFYLPAIMLLNFRYTKAVYNIKRLNYAYSVFGKNADYYLRLLPEKLPDSCEDYSFITKGRIIAPDYHPSSCLIFRTDEETIDSYAQYYSAMCSEISEKDEESGESVNKIGLICQNAGIDESRSREFDDAELYFVDENFSTYPKGALLDRDSGYVVILT